jgi:lambda family phage tail tape measure protein
MAAATQTRKILIQIDTAGSPGLKDAVDKLSALQQNANSLAKGMSFLTGVFASFLGYLSVTNLTRMSDDFQNLTQRLKLTAQAGEDSTVTFQKILDMADRTKLSIGDVGNVYNRLSVALAGAKPSADQLIAVEEALINTFKLSRVGAAQTATSIEALGRAFARGQIQGRDLKSVLGDNVVLIEAFRQKFGGDLTQKAQSGVIKLSDLLKVLANISEDVNKKAEALAPTFGETMTRATNKLEAAVGELNKTMGLSSGFAIAMEGVMNHLGDVVFTVGGLIALTVLPSIISAFNKLKLAFLAIGDLNPYVLAFTALVVVGGLIYSNFDKLKNIFDDVAASFLRLLAKITDGAAKISDALSKLSSRQQNGDADRANADSLRKQADALNALAEARRKAQDPANIYGPQTPKDLINGLANKPGVDQASDKKEKLKQVLADLNKEYLSGAIDIDQYNQKLIDFDFYKIARQFEEGATDINKVHASLEKLDIQNLNKQLNDGSISFKQWNDSANQAQIKLLTEEYKAGTISLFDYNTQMQKLTDNFLPGSAFEVGVYDYYKSVGTLSENIAKGITNTFTQLGNTIDEFIKTGTFNFKAFTQTILDDLTKIIVQALILKPIAAGILGSITGTPSQVNASSGGTDANGGSYGGVQAAYGAAFANGVRKFAGGGIVNSATAFSYGNGQRGVMGEAGTEAIMPLQRGSDGRLGVASTPSNVIVNIHNNVGANVTQSESTGPNGEKTLDILVESSVKKGLATGKYDSAFKNSYGLARKGN